MAPKPEAYLSSTNLITNTVTDLNFSPGEDIKPQHLHYANFFSQAIHGKFISQALAIFNLYLQYTKAQMLQFCLSRCRGPFTRRQLPDHSPGLCIMIDHVDWERDFVFMTFHESGSKKQNILCFFNFHILKWIIFLLMFVFVLLILFSPCCIKIAPVYINECGRFLAPLNLS